MALVAGWLGRQRLKTQVHGDYQANQGNLLDSTGDLWKLVGADVVRVKEDRYKSRKGQQQRTGGPADVVLYQTSQLGDRFATGYVIGFQERLGPDVGDVRATPGPAADLDKLGF